MAIEPDYSIKAVPVGPRTPPRLVIADASVFMSRDKSIWNGNHVAKVMGWCDFDSSPPQSISPTLIVSSPDRSYLSHWLIASYEGFGYEYAWRAWYTDYLHRHRQDQDNVRELVIRHREEDDIVWRLGPSGASRINVHVLLRQYYESYRNADAAWKAALKEAYPCLNLESWNPRERRPLVERFARGDVRVPTLLSMQPPGTDPLPLLQEVVILAGPPDAIAARAFRLPRIQSRHQRSA